MRIRDPGSGSRDGDSSDPGSGMEKVGYGIRDKHPGSATLILPMLYQSLIGLHAHSCTLYRQIARIPAFCIFFSYLLLMYEAAIGQPK